MFCCRPTCPYKREGNIIYVVETGPRGPMGPIGPQGPSGPQGPVGPAGGGINSYGGLYSVLQTARTITPTYSTLTLESTMPSNNVTYGTNTITVVNSGTYEVNYGLTADTSETTVVTTAVAVNGATVGGGTMGTSGQAGQNIQQTGTVLLTLVAGDVLTLQANSVLTTTLTPQGGVVGYLTIKQLG